MCGFKFTFVNEEKSKAKNELICLQKSKFYEISYAIRATPVLIFTFIMQGKLTMR